jgi:hypothetical protein
MNDSRKYRRRGRKGGLIIPVGPESEKSSRASARWECEPAGGSARESVLSKGKKIT